MTLAQIVATLDDLGVHSMSQGPGESWNLCIHSVVQLHDASQMFVMVDCVREMTVKKLCMKNMGRLSFCSSCF